jgi:hypothetical protein
MNVNIVLILDSKITRVINYPLTKTLNEISVLFFDNFTFNL